MISKKQKDQSQEALSQVAMLLEYTYFLALKTYTKLHCMS